MSTDMPDVPGSLPIAANVSVQQEALHIAAERTETLGADISFEFDIPKADIAGVEVRFAPDVPDDFEYSPWNQPECSSATLLHRDPYGVVPEFRTVFTSTKSYWIKALRKMLCDRLGIEAKEDEYSDI